MDDLGDTMIFGNTQLLPPKFNSSPLKSDRNPIGKVIFQPPIFQGYIKLRGCILIILFIFPDFPECGLGKSCELLRMKPPLWGLARATFRHWCHSLAAVYSGSEMYPIGDRMFFFLRRGNTRISIKIKSLQFFLHFVHQLFIVWKKIINSCGQLSPVFEIVRAKLFSTLPKKRF